MGLVKKKGAEAKGRRDGWMQERQAHVSPEIGFAELIAGRTNNTTCKASKLELHVHATQQIDAATDRKDGEGGVADQMALLQHAK